jgi:hypothetical protein
VSVAGTSLDAMRFLSRSKSSSSKLERHPIKCAKCASIILEEAPITPSHVAEKFAGLPNLQPEILFLGAALSKLNSHRCSAT